MQYDLVLLDFYRAKDAEAWHIASALHRLRGPLFVVLLALLCVLGTEHIWSLIPPNGLTCHHFVLLYVLFHRHRTR